MYVSPESRLSPLAVPNKISWNQTSMLCSPLVGSCWGYLAHWANVDSKWPSYVDKFQTPRQGKPCNYCTVPLLILSPPELNGSFVIRLKPIRELICEKIPRYLMLTLLFLLVMTHSSIIYMSFITDRAATNQSCSMFLCLLYLTRVTYSDYMQLHIEICII